MEEALIRYLHFLGIIFLSCTLFAENLLLSKRLEKKLIKKLVIIDAFYGIAAVVTFFAGYMLWFSMGKPKEFYTSNILFQIKVMVFVVIGVLSIIPTIFFLKNRKAEGDLDVPNYVLVTKRIEISLLPLLPLLAALMARGIGN